VSLFVSEHECDSEDVRGHGDDCVHADRTVLLIGCGLAQKVIVLHCVGVRLGLSTEGTQLVQDAIFLLVKTRLLLRAKNGERHVLSFQEVNSSL